VSGRCRCGGTKAGEAVLFEVTQVERTAVNNDLLAQPPHYEAIGAFLGF
jgi:hypothetical protein